MNNIDDTLKERGSVHGEFADHARLTQALKNIMHLSPNWERLSDIQKEALEMNAHKIGRILAGDPNYDDHWKDIAGYARLVEVRLIAAREDDDATRALARKLKPELSKQDTPSPFIPSRERPRVLSAGDIIADMSIIPQNEKSSI